MEYVKISIERYNELKEIERVHDKAFARVTNREWGTHYGVEILTDKKEFIKLIEEGRKDYVEQIERFKKGFGIDKLKIDKLERDIEKLKRTWW